MYEVYSNKTRSGIALGEGVKAVEIVLTDVGTASH
jgi:hypothetical protein